MSPDLQFYRVVERGQADRHRRLGEVVPQRLDLDRLLILLRSADLFSRARYIDIGRRSAPAVKEGNHNVRLIECLSIDERLLSAAQPGNAMLSSATAQERHAADGRS